MIFSSVSLTCQGISVKYQSVSETYQSASVTCHILAVKCPIVSETCQGVFLKYQSVSVKCQSAKESPFQVDSCIGKKLVSTCWILLYWKEFFSSAWRIVHHMNEELLTTILAFWKKKCILSINQISMLVPMGREIHIYSCYTNLARSAYRSHGIS